MKFVGVWPLARVFYMRSGEATYTALLMATGLTFGTISALFCTRRAEEQTCALPIYEVCGRVAAGAGVLYAVGRGDLYGAADGHGADIRDHLGTVWLAEQDH